MNSDMDKQLRRKIFSTLFIMSICVAVMVVLWRFAPVQATTTTLPTETAAAIASETPTETPSPAQSEAPTEVPSQEPSETPAETPTETASPENTEAPSASPEETGTPAATESSQPATQTPAPTKTPAPTPVVPTTPPKLELLTPPGVTAPAATTPADVPPTEDTGFEEEIIPGATFEPTPTPRVEHIEQVEMDAGFQLSDFIEILCWVAYTLAGTFLLFGLARIAILMLLKRDILPSKKEREKAKAEKLRKAAEKEHKIIETDISREEYQLHKDDWNWK